MRLKLNKQKLCFLQIGIKRWRWLRWRQILTTTVAFFGGWSWVFLTFSTTWTCPGFASWSSSRRFRFCRRVGWGFRRVRPTRCWGRWPRPWVETIRRSSRPSSGRGDRPLTRPCPLRCGRGFEDLQSSKFVDCRQQKLEQRQSNLLRGSRQSLENRCCGYLDYKYWLDHQEKATSEKRLCNNIFWCFYRIEP